MSVTTSNQIKTPEIQSNLNNRTSASQLEQKNKDLLSLQNKVNQIVQTFQDGGGQAVSWCTLYDVT
jgi:hypothetical protein